MRAARVDANQTLVVRELRQAGMSVQILSPVGQGVPDLLVGFQGRNYLFEVKNPNADPKDRRLTPDEKRWFDGWAGQVDVVFSAAEALVLIRAHARIS